MLKKEIIILFQVSLQCYLITKQKKKKNIHTIASKYISSIYYCSNLSNTEPKYGTAILKQAKLRLLNANLFMKFNSLEFCIQQKFRWWKYFH